MLAQGYRSVDGNDYRAVLSFCEATLDEDYVETLKVFAASERQRHNEMYDGCFSLTSGEAAHLLTKAEKFIAGIKAALHFKVKRADPGAGL
jgi:uncharacterized protein (UPF0332 family)